MYLKGHHLKITDRILKKSFLTWQPYSSEELQEKN
jgi:hypothetical protein